MWVYTGTVSWSCTPALRTSDGDRVHQSPPHNDPSLLVVDPCGRARSTVLHWLLFAMLTAATATGFAVYRGRTSTAVEEVTGA